jgi:hypothetical protein
MFYGFQESSLKTITETIFKTGNWSTRKKIVHENVFSV